MKDPHVGARLLRVLTIQLILALAIATGGACGGQAAGEASSANRQRQKDVVAPLRPEQMPAIASREVIVQSLWRSFTEWQPKRDPSGKIDRSAVFAALGEARGRLVEKNQQNDFDALLGAAVSAGQLFWALNNALAESDSQLLDDQDSHRVMERLRQLSGETLGSTLRVEVLVLVRSVSITDNARDEIRLDLIINAGAPADQLVKYMADNKMIDQSEVPELTARWKSADAEIGDTDRERWMLNKCLGVSLTEAIEQKDVLVFYNYGPYSKYIWRDAAVSVTYPARFNTADYPFDKTTFPILFTATSALDSSKLLLAPYGEATSPISTRLSNPPRGFRFLRQTPNLIPVSVQDNANTLPRPALLYVFQMGRRLNTAIWRTFLPLLMIVIFGLVATLRTMATYEHLGTIMASLLPSLTVACVALQWTASSSIPGHSGGTVMDRIFVCIYLYFFLLFLALNTHHLRWISFVMLGCAMVPIAYALHFFVRMI